MPRPRKPARLWLDSAAGVWCILDAGKKRRLGVGASDRAEAERLLEAYLTAKRSLGRPTKGRTADAISVAEVMDRYLSRACVKRPKELAQRAEAILDYWGENTLGDVDEDSCCAFVEKVGSRSYGRRCLEDLRAATNAYARAGFLREQVTFTMPKKPEARIDWLTWEEAVALCRTAWRHREIQRGGVTSKWTTRHVCKFIAVAIATCSRSARIYEASYDAEVGHPWVDLEEKIFYRAAQDENVPANKRAPPIPLGERILAAMKRWHAKGDRYVVEWAGKPANCKRAFAQTVLRARKQNPDLFKRPDGTPKEVVRHTLRHTGITWLALAGVDPYEICKFAGLSMEVFERVYSHHHPAYMRGVMKAQRKGNKLVAAE